LEEEEEEEEEEEVKKVGGWRGHWSEAAADLAARPCWVRPLAGGGAEAMTMSIWERSKQHSSWEPELAGSMQLGKRRQKKRGVWDGWMAI
jgi:hypothetical protein